MMTHPRVILESCSVAIIAVVNVTAAGLGPDDARPVLLLCGVVALVGAVQNTTLRPAGFTSALYFSLPPVIALLADDSTTWLIGPLGALLLIACELHALSRDYQGRGPIDAVARRRLLDIGRLGVLGGVASLAIGVVASAASLGGTTAVFVAAVALGALAGVLFGR